MEVGKASPSDRSAALVLDIVGQKSRLSGEPAALGSGDRMTWLDGAR